jgi:glycosyltransferase involved in cell wall biosynthesis
LAWGINLVLADTVRLKSWGRNARDRAIAEFSWQRAAEKTLEIYEELA